METLAQLPLAAAASAVSIFITLTAFAVCSHFLLGA
jgi:hypothetical protein